jgi:hypothetical protein
LFDNPSHYDRKTLSAEQGWSPVNETYSLYVVQHSVLSESFYVTTMPQFFDDKAIAEETFSLTFGAR